MRRCGSRDRGIKLRDRDEVVASLAMYTESGTADVSTKAHASADERFRQFIEATICSIELNVCCINMLARPRVSHCPHIHTSVPAAHSQFDASSLVNKTGAPDNAVKQIAMVVAVKLS